jgi:hypothetical protein
MRTRHVCILKVALMSSSVFLAYLAFPLPSVFPPYYWLLMHHLSVVALGAYVTSMHRRVHDFPSPFIKRIGGAYFYSRWDAFILIHLESRSEHRSRQTLSVTVHSVFLGDIHRFTWYYRFIELDPINNEGINKSGRSTKKPGIMECPPSTASITREHFQRSNLCQ